MTIYTTPQHQESLLPDTKCYFTPAAENTETSSTKNPFGSSEQTNYGWFISSELWFCGNSMIALLQGSEKESD